jgi:hypothetical protein
LHKAASQGTAQESLLKLTGIKKIQINDGQGPAKFTSKMGETPAGEWQKAHHSVEQTLGGMQETTLFY